MPTPRLFGLVCLALAFASPALAGSVCTDGRPPDRYLSMPAPDYTLIVVPNTLALHRHCSSEPMLGCAKRKTMTIYVLERVTTDPVRFRCLLRHEEAHLLGWPGDHPL